MAGKRLLPEEQRKDLKDIVDLREKKLFDLTEEDIKKLVIVMAKRMGLLK